MFVKAILLAIALFLLGYAFALWRDPTVLYRSNWFSRQTYGWLEGRKELPVVARGEAIVAVVVAGVIVASAFVIV